MEDSTMKRAIVAAIAAMLLGLCACAAPIHSATSEGDAAKVKQLLAAAKEVASQADESGATPVWLAAEACKPDVLQVLLDAGANPNVGHTKGTDRRRPLDVLAAMAIDTPDDAAKAPDAQKARATRADCISLLLAAGADVTALDNRGDAPLHTAALSHTDKSPNLDIIALLAGTKGGANVRNGNGDTPLHCAMQVRQYDVAKLLVCKGADATIAGKDGDTALHLAVRAKDARLVELLLDNHADAKVANKAGKTPVDLAKDGGDPAITAQLGCK
jgi:cytohesin